MFYFLVVVDGINVFWGRIILKREDKSLIVFEELVFVYNLRKMMKNDWYGGVIVLVLS